MPTILQLRRGSTAENDAYTGSVGELTVDTTLNTVRVHDGSTAGGTVVGKSTGNIQVAVTGDNEIDTSSGNLTIDSAGGTTTLDDNVVISGNLTVSGTTTTVNSTTIDVQNALRFEGSTSDDYETTLTVTDPTADRTITFPDATGNVAVFATAPTAAITDGSAGQFLKTDGSGALSFATVSADLVGDTTPQLGGTLDLNNQGISGSGTINISGGSLLLKSNAPNGTNNGPIIGSNTANNVSGFGNMALGTNAGRDFGNCQGNIAVGTGSLLRTTTGSNNTSVGREAMRQNTTGGANTAVGYQALDNTTGGSNTAVGNSAGSTLTTGSNNTLLGQNAEPSSATVSNEITLGNSSVTIVRTNGSIMPFTDNAQDLGSSSLQWQNIYTGDLHLSNERHQEGNSVDGTTGNWTIQEGADDLFIINNKNGKKFKFSLKEVQ